MADFSPSSIAELPPTTAETLERGDPRVLGWLLEAVQEGDRLNRSDPAYDGFETRLRYVSGEQRLDPSGDKIPYLPRVQINQVRKAVQAHTSALTDVKPLFGFKTGNDAFQFQSHLLNQLTVIWWVNTMADLELGNCVKYALAGGTGDLKVEWDPYAGLGGDHALIASDPRDTLALRPSLQRNPQLWQGVTFREEHTLNTLKGIYPAKAHLLRATTDSFLDSLKGRFRTIVQALRSPAADTLSGLSRPAMAAQQTARSGQVLLYRTFLTDQTRNLTGQPIAMGDPTSAGGYVVQHGDFLYPQKRLIVGTPDAILYDGPSPFWHGMFPFARLKLWELPWHFLGLSLIHDLIPLQDAINETANDIRLGIKQWMEPAVKFDRAAVSESFMRLFDARKPGAKIKTNPQGANGWEKLPGPDPAALQLAMEFLTGMIEQFRDLSGTTNLQQLLELRQMPGADTIRQYYEALTPELRQEGRMIEAFLRDVGEMTKVNTFQYQSVKKRLLLLGDAGLALQDFDYDPGTLVPALNPGDQGYTEELDAKRSAVDRAKFFHKQFVFTVAPNSILAMNAQEQKMLRLQLARMGYYDFWSLMTDLEIPNVGTPPPMPLPPLEPPDPALVMQDLMAQAGIQLVQDPVSGQQVPQPTGMPQPPQKYVLDPASGQIMELRVPQTITERLMAQQALGIGMTENPAGRKATGQSSPQIEEKKDQTGAPRQTVTESAPSKNA